MNKSSTSKPSQTDWAKVDALSDTDLDYSDSPKISPEFFVTGKLRKGQRVPVGKEAISIRLDRDILEWLRSRGSGYQSEVNALLRAYMQSQQQTKSS
jgi:uncharacterized protein (DUF4415 family)